MKSTQVHSRHIHRVVSSTAAALVLVGLAGTPATARPDPGPGLPPTSTLGCPLERVGSQLVRCDNLTGNGVPAPAYIPEQ